MSHTDQPLMLYRLQNVLESSHARASLSNLYLHLNDPRKCCILNFRLSVKTSIPAFYKKHNFEYIIDTGTSLEQAVNNLEQA